MIVAKNLEMHLSVIYQHTFFLMDKHLILDDFYSVTL